MDMTSTLSPQPSIAFHVDSRRDGLPGLALGGYVAGLLAGAIAAPTEVNLRRPVSTPAELTVAPAETGWLELRDAETAVAYGRAAELQLEIPEPPSAAEAARAAEHFLGLHRHPYPDCYACGPGRGDGLRIFP